MTKVRNGPNCASIGLAHDAFVGVKHSLTLCFAAQARIAGVLFADRLSRMTVMKLGDLSVACGSAGGAGYMARR
jgi:hypothetical protein